MGAIRRVLVTGATGFVGRHLRVALDAAGYELRLGSRDPARARRDDPEGDWVRLDIDRPETLPGALEGCDAAYFLVHHVGASGDYVDRERRAAEALAAAAGEAGLKRIVYLGGVVPKGRLSPHLESRLATGRILGEGPVPVVELRAAMVIGHGSASWRMVRDLANRLPAMVLPRWLGRHSWPVAVDDVVRALLAALDAEPGCYALPGPERLTHREVLIRASRLLGRHTVMVGVPILSPRLSSYWIGWVTSVDLPLARELVQGLVTDLDPTDPPFWPRTGEVPLTSVTEAMSVALADDAAGEEVSKATRARLERIGNAQRPSA